MREEWGSRLGFILAIAGSAIGLGNIWKFPYMCGMNGGGAFVVVYLACVLLVGFPLLLLELIMGRAAQSSTVGAFSKLAPAKGLLSDLLGGALLLVGVVFLCLKHPGYGGFMVFAGAAMLLLGWKTLGYLCGMLLPMLIIMYYSVIGGWTIVYICRAFSGNLDFTDQLGAEAVMTPIATSTGMAGVWVLLGTVAFTVMCAAVLLCGVKNGIEKWSKILMPSLFILLLVLIVRGLTLPGAKEGVAFFLSPDFSKLSTNGVLAALGHSFFSMSLAMGIVLTYGSYINRKENLINSAVSVLVLDSTAALLAGLAIFPAVFAMGFAENSGPVLIYQVLPAAFNRIPGGLSWLWNGIFFLMIAVAALTSGISLLEPPVRICMEEFKLSRKKAVCTIAGICVAGGAICSFSMSDWAHFPSMGKVMDYIWNGDAPGSLFAAFDNFSCNWMLPLAGVLSAIYVGWIWGSRHAVRELGRGAKGIYNNLWYVFAGLPEPQAVDKDNISPLSFALLWGISIRFVSPVLVIMAFYQLVK